MNNISCKNCHKEFEVIDKRPGRTKYCSNNCKYIGVHKDQEFWKHANEEEKLDKLRISYDKKVVKQDGCWDWLGALKTGYGCVRFGKKTLRIHRLSWLIHNGNIPDNKWILHKCDNKKCSNPDHLFLGTRLDNIRDMNEKERNVNPIGEKNGRAKITKVISDEIKKLLNLNSTPLEIAEKYGIDRHIVYKIRRGKTWA